MKITINNITKIYSETVIFDDCNAEIVLGSKTAITGLNGSGKSTLLKMISGLENYQEGDIFIPKDVKVGYLKQVFEHQEVTAFEYIQSSFQTINELKTRMNKLEDLMVEDYTNEKHMINYGKVQEEFIAAGGYDLENDIERIAKGLNIYDHLNDPYNNMSGGQKTRIELVKLLASNIDVFCLDEPTNHLDLKGIEWLEDFIQGSSKTFIVVSHDRKFLDNVVNQYLDIQYEQLVRFTGSFRQFREQKKKNYEHLVKDYKLQQAEILRIKKIIKMYRQWAYESGNDAFFKKAKAQEKRLKRIERLPKPEDLNSKLKLEVKNFERSGKQVLVLKDLLIGYDDPLCLPIDLNVYYKDRVNISGENGVGKTTLIKTITKDLKPLDGEIIVGSNVKIGYLEQEEKFKDEDKRILDHIQYELNTSEYNARLALAQIGFFQSDVFRPLKQLSGGEQVRIKLLCLMHLGHNLLLLDEPTNHLDLESCEILEEMLNTYEGTIVVVSHDRYFLEEIHTEAFELIAL